MTTIEQVKIYTNWITNVLVGGNPVASDQYLKDWFFTIHKVASALYKDLEIKPIYRGILMDEKITELQPHPNMTYLSFSESKDVATHFGNNIDGFPCLKKFRYGYVIEYTPKREEILFHWSMFEKLPIQKIVEAADIPAGTMPAQKEVTILQGNTTFQVKPWKEFHPNYDRMCLGPRTSSFLDLILNN